MTRVRHEHDPEDRDQQRVEQEAEAEGDDPLGPLHEAAAWRRTRATRPWPARRRSASRRRARRAAARRCGRGGCVDEVPGDAAEEQGVGEAVGHRVEEGATGRAVPEALATAPSSTSGRAVSTSSSRPARRAPLPMATAAPPAMTTPRPVRWSAVMPVRLMLAPTGRRRFSAWVRKRPSNMGVSSELVLLAEASSKSTDRSADAPRSARSLPDRCGPGTPAPARYHPDGRRPPAHRPGGAHAVLPAGRRSATWPWSATAGRGKTTLAEALLHCAGAINRIGRVEDGTTVSDYDPEEQRRGISLSLAVAPFEWKGHKVNLIDTPGYADFIGDVHAALRVADLAVFVVSAVEGVEVQTEAIWRLAAELGVPRMVFINKLDRERADFERTLDQLREPLRRRRRAARAARSARRPTSAASPTCSPTRPGPTTAARPPTARSPTRWRPLEHQVHDNLVEGIVVADDELLERYLDGEVPVPRAARAHPGRRRRRGHACSRSCAARRPPGSRSTASPTSSARSARRRSTGPPVTVEAGDDDRRRGARPRRPARSPFVFKTVADQFVGHISLFKVLSGHDPRRRPPGQQPLRRPTSGCTACSPSGATSRSRPAQVVGRRHRGRGRSSRGTVTGDTLAPKGTPVTVPTPIEFPEPLLAVGHHRPHPGRRRQARQRAPPPARRGPGPAPSTATTRPTRPSSGASARPTSRSPLERLDRKFGVAGRHRSRCGSATARPSPATPRSVARHKKQSGGHGQFGECAIRVDPRRAGRRLRSSSTRSSAAPSPRATSRRCRRASRRPWPAAAPSATRWSTCAVELFDGKEHTVDSSEMAFKIAGPRWPSARRSPRPSPGAARAGVAADRGRPRRPAGRRAWATSTPAGAGCRAPSRSARASRPSPRSCPTSELLRYPIDLRSLTGGRARFTARHDHYDVMPPHLADAVRRDVVHED